MKGYGFESHSPYQLYIVVCDTSYLPSVGAARWSCHLTFLVRPTSRFCFQFNVCFVHVYECEKSKLDFS